MDTIIEKLLTQDLYKTTLSDYTYIPFKEWDTIPLGSHIKFIDRNENIKSGGFLIKCVKNKDKNKNYYIIKSNIIYKLYCYYFWIFYKKTSTRLKSPNIIVQLSKMLDNKSKEIISDLISESNITSKKIIPDLISESNITSNEFNNIISNTMNIKIKSKENKSKRTIFKDLLNSLDQSSKK